MLRTALQPGRHAPGCETASLAKAQPNQIGKLKRSLPPWTVGIADPAHLSDVTDGIGALVAVIFGIGRGADSDGVQHQDQGTHVGSRTVGREDAAEGATPVFAQ
ncbi:hypothetical protein ACVWWK_004647 [Bradyrhizobium sp. LB9.1b]